MIHEIKKDNVILARHITADEIKEGLSFFSEDFESIQVGSWNYQSGKALMRHIHNEVERKIMRTQEVLYIIEGKIEANVYDLDENLVETLVVGKGDVLVLLDSGHGYQILEDGTKVLEVKNGPYLGAEIDRRRF
jgi:oxalate decarboxylase/phosphoglucose isomerase-like protein (cupin superfamily)